jgi:hypothetical protein
MYSLCVMKGNDSRDVNKHVQNFIDQTNITILIFHFQKELAWILIEKDCKVLVGIRPAQSIDWLRVLLRKIIDFRAKGKKTWNSLCK